LRAAGRLRDRGVQLLVGHLRHLVLDRPATVAGELHLVAVLARLHALGLLDPGVDPELGLADRVGVDAAVVRDVDDLIDQGVGTLIGRDLVQLLELGVLAQSAEDGRFARHALELAHRADALAVRNRGAELGGQLGLVCGRGHGIG
jgi:hypothetical protein